MEFNCHKSLDIATMLFLSHTKCSYSAITLISIELLFLWNVWNLFFIFGLDPITHVHTLKKGESDSTLKFKISQLCCVSCDNLTSVFVCMGK